MSAIFDRTVTQKRARDVVPERGMRYEAFETVATGIRCSIQLKKSRRATGYPEDDTGSEQWQIFVTRCHDGDFARNDILVDDLERELRVEAAYPTPLGWNLLASDWTVGARR
ncbi:hypothetical protein J7643_03695 [bacterium]|nr:hypothetical protein [bacterium]